MLSILLNVIYNYYTRATLSRMQQSPFFMNKKKKVMEASSSKPRHRTENITCFNCKENGHPSFKCPRPLIKCTNCNLIGHASINCPRINKTVTSTQSNNNIKNVLEISVKSTPNDKYRFMIKINKTAIMCQLDLGSEATLIREKDAKAIGFSWQPVNGPYLRGLRNIPYLPLGHAFVEIEVQGILEPQVEIYVVENNLINMPVLLGHSFTERPTLKIMKTATDLQFDRLDMELEFKITLSAITDIIIEVRELKALSVKSDKYCSGTSYVRDSVRGRPGREHYILPGEYELINGECNLLVQNVGTRSIFYKANILVTRARFLGTSKNVYCINYDQSISSFTTQINYGQQLTKNEIQQRIDLLQKIQKLFFYRYARPWLHHRSRNAYSFKRF